MVVLSFGPDLTWIRTLLWMMRRLRSDEQRVEARRDIAPPVRGNTKKGSVLIRDMRLWHRGMPNHSDRPRQMIAMVHNIHWFRRRRRVPFNKGCEEVFENCQIDSKR